MVRKKQKSYLVNSLKYERKGGRYYEAMVLLQYMWSEIVANRSCGQNIRSIYQMQKMQARNSYSK